MGVSLVVVVAMMHLFLVMMLGLTKGEKNVMVVGNVYCDQCLQHNLTKNAIFLQGVSISIECKDQEGYNLKTIIATTNKKGYFQAKLQGDHANSTCYAYTQSNPNVDCNVRGLHMKKPLDFELAYSNGNILTYSLGYFTFLPLNIPSFCQQTTYEDHLALKAHKPHKHHETHTHHKSHEHHNSQKPHAHNGTNPPKDPKTLAKKPTMYGTKPPRTYNSPSMKPPLYGPKLPKELNSLIDKPPFYGNKPYINAPLVHEKNPLMPTIKKPSMHVSDPSKSQEWNIHLPPLFGPKRPLCGPKLPNPPKPPMDGPKPPKPPLDGPNPPKPPSDGPKPLEPPLNGPEPPKDLNSQSPKAPNPPKPPLDGPKPPKPPLNGPKPPEPQLCGPKPPKPPLYGPKPPKPPLDGSKPPKPPLCGPRPPEPLVNGPKTTKPPMNGSNPTNPPLYGQNPP